MFTFPLELPSGKIVRVPELTNRSLFTIIKFCLANDLSGLNQFVEQYIFNNRTDLTCIDKLYILLYIRSFTLGDTIVLAVEHESVKTIQYSIQNIISNIEALPVIHDEQYKIGDVTLSLTAPSLLYFDEVDSLYIDLIKSITIDNTVTDVKTYSIEDKTVLYNRLPITYTTALNSYYKTLSSLIGDVTLIDRNETYNLDKIGVNMLSTQPLQFVKSIFSQDLPSFLQFMYQFVNKVGGSFDDFFNLNINDSKIILDFYREEMEKQNDELKKAHPHVK